MDRGGGRCRARRIRQVARIGNNLNQLARWANTHGAAVEAVSVIANLVSFEGATQRGPLRPGR